MEKTMMAEMINGLYSMFGIDISPPPPALAPGFYLISKFCHDLVIFCPICCTCCTLYHVYHYTCCMDMRDPADMANMLF